MLLWDYFSFIILICGCGGIGRRTSLRSWRLRCAGSTPVTRTTSEQALYRLLRFFTKIRARSRRRSSFPQKVTLAATSKYLILIIGDISLHEGLFYKNELNFYLNKYKFCVIIVMKYMGLWRSWERVRFASERSRVQIPSGPPACRWSQSDQVRTKLRLLLRDMSSGAVRYVPPA